MGSKKLTAKSLKCCGCVLVKSEDQHVKKKVMKELENAPKDPNQIGCRARF